MAKYKGKELSQKKIKGGRFTPQRNKRPKEGQKPELSKTLQKRGG